ncbi:folate family ECF transporter S component [Lactobacillus sp. Sy-1]|uniref:folate family ECF transporter S component n=1 Tax=Lactobacillus sp. Sy-1 TaxID=2109645 RepID=UPI001C5632B7|nr:folate family ECF transporter S component [Lactobacillus sp. Sy-1]MBW1605578.1 folate family ECF transporter S component [Lactobacillus sp. Sy-1]
MHTQKKVFAQPNASGIAILGLLTAIRLILGSSLFTFYLVPNKIQFSFAFIATFLIAMWFGPFWAGAIAGFADIFLTLISGQIYFPGFTLSAVLGGVIFGLFFFNHKPTLKTIIISQVIVVVVINLILNTTWVVILNHVPFEVIFLSRFIKEIFTVVIQIIIMYLISKNQTIISLGNRLRK